MRSQQTREEDTKAKIQKHGEYLLKIYPFATDKDPISLYTKLRGLEVKAKRMCLDLCPGVNPDLEVTIERHLQQMINQVYSLLGIGNKQPQVYLNKDPKGYVFKIPSKAFFPYDLDMIRDMEGNGIIAPDLSF